MNTSASLPPPVGIWRISCITKIAANIDNHYNGPVVVSAACLQREEAPLPEASTEKKGKSKSGGGGSTPPPSSPPVVYWLKDARHLQCYNPLLFVVHGPADYTTAKKAAEDYKPQDFSLVPRFDPRRPPAVQVEEYVRLRSGPWESKAGFRKYWEKFFNEMFLNTIEAKAPVLLSRDASGLTLERAQYVLYCAKLAEYFDHYSKKLDESSDRLNRQVSALSSSSDSAGKKRKRGAASSESSGNSNQSAGSNDDAMVDETREQQLLVLTSQLAQLRQKFYDPEVLAFTEKRLSTETREATSVMRTDKDTLQRLYHTYYTRFLEAVDEEHQMIKAKKRANERRAIFENFLNSLNSPLAGGGGSLTSLDASSNTRGIGEGEEDEDDEEEGAGGDETTQPPITDEALAGKIRDALSSHDVLTCCIVAQRIAEAWKRRLGYWDEDIVNAYIRAERIPVEITEGLKRQSEIERTLHPFNPEPLIHNLRPFASTLFWTRVPLYAQLLTAIRLLPHWSLALVRALSSCQSLAVHFGRSYRDFSVYLCGQTPPVARSAIRHFLHFLRPAFDSEADDGSSIDKNFAITRAWLRQTVLAASPAEVFEKLSKMTAGSGNVAPVEFVNYTMASGRFLRVVSLTSPNKWTVSDEDWNVAVTSLTIQTNHLRGSLKEQRLAFMTHSKNVTDALSERGFLRTILNAPVACHKLHIGQEFVCQPRESVLYCIQRSQDDCLVLDTATKTAPRNSTPASSLPATPNSFAGAPWLSEDKWRSPPPQASASRNRQPDLPPPSFWLCNRSITRQWIDIVTTLRRVRITRLGCWWNDLEFCPTAVDLSIWMTRVLRDFFDAPDQEDPMGSMVVVLPEVIRHQLLNLVSSDEKDPAAWSYEWLELSEPRSTDVGRRIILSPASNLSRHAEELGSTGCIVLAHAEALQLNEWELVCAFLNNRADAGQSFVRRAFLLYNPVLGGFSNQTQENDTSNLHLLVAYSEEIAQSVPIGGFEHRGRQLPSDTWIYSTASKNKQAKQSKRRAIDDDGGDDIMGGLELPHDEGEEDFGLDLLTTGEDGLIKKRLFAFCTRLLSFRRPTSADVKLTTATSFVQETHAADREWIKGMAVKYLGRLARISLAPKQRSGGTPAIVSEVPSPLLMAQIQNNIPFYQLIEHWVNSRDTGQAIVLTPDDQATSSFFAGIPPLRLANALARLPPQSIAFATRALWDQYTSYWSQRSALEFLEVARSYPIAIRASAMGKFTPERFDAVINDLVNASTLFKGSGNASEDFEAENAIGDDRLLEFDSGARGLRARGAKFNASLRTPAAATTTTTTTSSKTDDGQDIMVVDEDD